MSAPPPEIVTDGDRRWTLRKNHAWTVARAGKYQRCVRCKIERRGGTAGGREYRVTPDQPWSPGPFQCLEPIGAGDGPAPRPAPMTREVKAERANVATCDMRRRRRREGVCVNSANHGPAEPGCAGRCLDCWMHKRELERSAKHPGAVRTRARWTGPLPAAGEFLRSTHKPRFCYEITEVVVSSTVGDLSYATFYLLRHPIADLPPEATAHDWRWDPRDRKRGP